MPTIPRPRWRALALGVIVALAGLPALAQTPAPSAPALEPEAAALDRMGAFLRSLERFEVTSEATSERAFTDRKLTFGQVTT
ncbi:MAG: hypothetical protein NZM40_01570 [Sphingomonadaceae bacterium]|uniref:hypothetical protein n=1 Tax=Thermaurantiacus sp. TaxID=2820283 RepID=UPI00298F0A96|nr:hypothetical protein [Thermaurantiacus sp.]MCS6986130.1 hypothetical protein [Sphingomonadaceae bacterium]MDW8414645.1 hypothetical protein [Thermaurantiacus sp.]